MNLTLNKVAAGFVGIAMVAGVAFAFTATRAHAADFSLSELVELFIGLGIIDDAKADEARAAVEGMEDTTIPSEGSTTCTGNFSRNLTIGDTGADVKELQQLLNASGFTVATGGSAGSPGMETMYYGPATAGAVTAMQNAFASEILTPLGLTTGTGYFGASTRAKANELCTPTTPDVPTLPGDDDDDDDMDDEDNDLSGGEVSLEDFDAKNSPKNVDLQEGDEEVAVAAWEFDVEDADALLKRVDAMFQVTGGTDGTTSDEPWDYIEAVQLWVNGEIVDEMDTDREDDWDDMTAKFTGDLTNEESYRLRFTGLSEKLDEGETAEIAISVTVVRNIDSNDEDAEITVWIPENGIRVMDGAGLVAYTGEVEDADADDIEHERVFMFESAGGDDELNVSLSTSNPKESIIKVETDDETDDVTIFVFDIEAEESDAELQTVILSITMDETGGTIQGADDLAQFENVFSDLVLEIDGDRFDDYTTDEDVAGDGIVVVTFDIDGDFMIDADDEVEVKLLASFQEQDVTTYENGVAVSAAVADDGVVADMTDDNIESDGTANGKLHQLLSEGIYAEIVSTDESTSGDNDTTGIFTIKFEVTAFEEDFYIALEDLLDWDGDATPDTIADAFAILVEGVDAAAATVNGSVSSTADEEDIAGDYYYVVREGDTETFTLKVNVSPANGDGGNYRASLVSIDYADNTGTAAGTHMAAPSVEFRTEYELVNGAAI